MQHILHRITVWTYTNKNIRTSVKKCKNHNATAERHKWYIKFSLTTSKVPQLSLTHDQTAGTLRLLGVENIIKSTKSCVSYPRGSLSEQAEKDNNWEEMTDASSAGKRVLKQSRLWGGSVMSWQSRYRGGSVMSWQSQYRGGSVMSWQSQCG